MQIDEPWSTSRLRVESDCCKLRNIFPPKFCRCFDIAAPTNDVAADFPRSLQMKKRVMQVWIQARTVKETSRFTARVQNTAGTLVPEGTSAKQIGHPAVERFITAPGLGLQSSNHFQEPASLGNRRSGQMCK